MLAVGELAEAVVEGTQIRDALCIQQLCVVSTAGGVDDLPCLLIGGKGPGQRRHGHLGLYVGQDAGGISSQIRCAYRDILHALGAVAAGQRVVGKHINGDASA